jgi:hypothetical protein
VTLVLKKNGILIVTALEDGVKVTVILGTLIASFIATCGFSWPV